jgi:hypothetical protein
MFRSSLLFVVAAACSQPIVAHAGDFHPTKSHVVVPHFNIPATTLPLMFAPRIPVVTFPHAILPQSRFPQPGFPQFNDRRFKHFETFSKWQSNRRLLGNPVGFETSVFSSRTQGSWMRFEHGYIVRYASGRTFLVRGGIGQAWIDNGGVYGSLGFPRGNEFEFNSQGHDAQVFERGMIHWNHMLGRFVVGPNKSKI